MIEINQEMDCCGVRELNNLSGGNSPKEVVQQLCNGGEYLYDQSILRENPRARQERGRYAFIIFSQAGPPRTTHYGTDLAKFITKNRLGTVTESPYKINPNTGNKLRVWIWALDPVGITKWWKKNKPTVEERARPDFSCRCPFSKEDPDGENRIIHMDVFNYCSEGEL